MVENMQTSASDGISLHYVVYGDGPLTVFLVHGWMVGAGVYEELLEVMDLSGLRVVVPSLRGVGTTLSSGTDYSIARYGADLICIADALECPRFVLVGHSMGGLIAQWLSASYPQRVIGQALLCPVPPCGVPFPDEMRTLFLTACDGDVAAQKNILEAVTVNLSAGRVETLLKETANISSGCLLASFEAWSGAKMTDLVATTTTPTLVVGSEDPAMPVEFLQQELVSVVASSQLKVISGAGHYVQVERPRATASVLQSFLTDIA